MVNNNDDNSNKGAVELYSYHCPNLLPGKYTVSIKHDITPPNSNWGKPEKWKSDRTFSVVGPRFSIPASDINSIYPIQGQRDEPRVLPHIMFNSPHLPWERPIDRWIDGNTNRTPRLALMPFTKDELHNSLIDPEISDLPALTSSLAYESTLSFLADKHAHTLFPDLMSEDSFSEEEKKHPVSFISLIPDKFLQLFDSQGEAGQAQHNLSLGRFRYFAHARTLNVQGTTLHPIAESARQQSFGLVTSHRCAPLNINKDETVYVHLVFLDGLQNIYAS